jgi:hypothetical protein
LLTGCVVAPPPGPSLTALPPQGKDLAAFQQEDDTCRQYAAERVGVAPAQAAQDSAVGSALLGTALGAAAGAAIGAATGNPGAGAAIGAGSGLLLGSAYGVDAAAVSGTNVQGRYDSAYVQCMASKGNSVPQVGTTTYPGPVAAYPAYPYPAYAYPYPYYYYPPPGYAYFGFSTGPRYRYRHRH